MSTIDITEVNFDSIVSCAAIGLLGKRRTGKTTWAKYIIQSLKSRCSRYIVLCGNRDNTSEWKEIIPALFIVTKCTAYLTKLRDYQDRKCSHYTTNGNEIPAKYILTIIFDDCGSDRSFMHSDIMKDILSNGRHYGMFILILAQYLNQMHCENRDQLDYLGILHTSNNRNVKKLHEEYCNICEIRTFKYILKALTTDKGLCWIDNTNNPSSISQFVFFKQLPWPCKFLPVCPDYVDMYATRHFLSNWDREVQKHISNDISEATVNVDTDGEDITEDIDLQDNSILNNRLVFNDKYGSIIVRKNLSKQKTE